MDRKTSIDEQTLDRLTNFIHWMIWIFLASVGGLEVARLIKWGLMELICGITTFISFIVIAVLIYLTDVSLMHDK